ncbi:MAG: hypothetical protein ACI9SG_002378 [Maribacter sp.]
MSESTEETVSIYTVSTRAALPMNNLIRCTIKKI